MTYLREGLGPSRPPVVFRLSALLACLLTSISVVGGPFEDGLAAFEAANRAQDSKHEGYAKAYVLWKELAGQGDGPSQYHLGILHMYGLGGAVFDQLAGFKLINRSAEAGYRQAQSYMGVMFEKGDGVFTRHDVAAARSWYHKAAQAGHCYAIRRLQRAYEKGELGLAPDPAQAQEWRQRETDCDKR